jgi:Nucleotidyltransferase domain
MNQAIDRAKDYSNAKLETLRTRLSDLVPSGDVVVTCGSYARREASQESDIDFFVILSNVDAADAPAKPKWFDTVKEAISEIVPVQPAEGGAFSEVESSAGMICNIGGDNDTNQKITRRMLFLLEGEWLFNQDGVKRVRRQILERYIRETMTDHQLALFLLNDIIRYYRTMAVDYEFKTTEGPKPWGIRNIKLVFSRKLLYASGLFSVAMTADRARNVKIDILERLFEMPIIDRMINICGENKMEGLLASYDRFLGKLEAPAVRCHLKKLPKEERDDSLFRELKNEGHYFTRELLKLFEETFDSTHPIRRAVIF